MYFSLSVSHSLSVSPSEFERKERDLKKRIGELSRGVQISDKDHEALKAELERVAAKAAKAEGKRAQVIKHAA